MTFPFPQDPLASEFSCPVAGLPFSSWPEWTHRRVGGDYRLTIRVIGDCIILNQPSGVAELQDIIESFELTEAVIRDHMDCSMGCVHISDYSGMRGITREARKYYINHMEKRNSMETVVKRWPCLKPIVTGLIWRCWISRCLAWMVGKHWCVCENAASGFPSWWPVDLSKPRRGIN